ncbi:MAG: thermostable hemolysin [Mariprofundus sp.]|nr:thermostable hemolysin [Mariprofundus sp.]
MFDVICKSDEDWTEVTQFIRETYLQRYGAKLDSFMPQIMRVTNSDGECKAIMGFRDASAETLFLENYLDEPIEAAISHYRGEHIERSTIVEVGSLAEAEPGDARMAIIAATAYMWSRGFRWVAFTGVSRMRNAFRKLGLDTWELTVADETRLSPEEVAKWGAYYQANPVVCFADIKHGHDNLQEMWTSLRDTWAAAEEAGLRDRDVR